MNGVFKKIYIIKLLFFLFFSIFAINLAISQKYSIDKGKVKKGKKVTFLYIFTINKEKRAEKQEIWLGQKIERRERKKIRKESRQTFREQRRLKRKAKRERREIQSRETAKMMKKNERRASKINNNKPIDPWYKRFIKNSIDSFQRGKKKIQNFTKKIFKKNG